MKIDLGVKKTGADTHPGEGGPNQPGVSGALARTSEERRKKAIRRDTALLWWSRDAGRGLLRRGKGQDGHDSKKKGETLEDVEKEDLS